MMRNARTYYPHLPAAHVFTIKNQVPYDTPGANGDLSVPVVV